MEQPTFDAVLRLAQALPYSEQVRLTYGLLPPLLPTVLAAAASKVTLTPYTATPEKVRAIFQPLITEGAAEEQQATLDFLVAVFERRNGLADACWLDIEPHARPLLAAVLPQAQALPRSEQVRLAHALLPQVAVQLQLAVQEDEEAIIPGTGTPESLAALFRSWIEEGDEEEQREALAVLREALPHHFAHPVAALTED